MPYRLLRTLLLFSCAVSPALAASTEYTVRGGDTAYAIARKFGLSVEQLLLSNGLSSPELKIGQRLNLVSSQPPPVPALPPVPPPVPTPLQSSEPLTHTVGPGDTLYSLARRAGVSVEALMARNNLSSPDLKLGMVLYLPSATGAGAVALLPAPPVLPALPAAVPVRAGSPGNTPLIELALRFLNVPYLYGGNSPAGLDCSGLVLQVYTPLGVQLPRRSQDQFHVGEVVERTALQEGDLVFFDTEGGGLASHVGILLQGEEFVHASTYDRRVTINRLSEKYYAERYLGARRPLPAVASRP